MGSLIGWGDPLVSQFDRVVCRTLDPALRLAGLHQREASRNGAAPIPAGGHYQAFMDWAMCYDGPTFTGRSRRKHRDWLVALPFRAIELDEVKPTSSRLVQLLAE